MPNGILFWFEHLQCVSFDAYNINNVCESAHHDIVPVPTNPVADNDTQQIKITTSNISVELPANIQPQLLKAAIEGLKC